jgi:hypothetical protein
VSVFYNLLTAAQATVQGLNLTWGQSVVQVEVSEQPLNRDGMDPSPLPVIWITLAADGEEVEQAATGGLVDTTYPVEITIVAAGNASFEANLSTYLDWREAMRLAFQRVHYSSVPGMWFVHVKPREVLNRDLQRDNYDLSVLQINFTVTEPAS